MPILAGWLTGEQVPQETIDQILLTMGEVLDLHGGQPARTIHPGAGLIAFSDPGYAMQRNDEPPVLDWVPDRRTLVYRRPLSGLHPLYYVEDWPAQGNLLFASEMKALLAVGVPRRLHLGALDALARYGFIPAPWTAFKDISIVPAGSILRWQHAKTVVNHATDYHLDELLTPPDTLASLHALLNEVTVGMLPSHEQLVALTGGESSSALCIALAAQQTSTPFSIASIGYKKSITAKGWREAEQIAEACQHPFLAVTGIDQPDFWTATLAATETPSIDTRPLALHQLLHMAATETEARIALSGLGASILLGADTNTLPETTGKESANLLSWYSRTQSLQRRGKAHLWSEDAATQLQKEESWEETLHARKLARQAAKFADNKLAWYYLDLHLRLPDYTVSATQQLAIQEHMVVRSPYLHAQVMEMLTRLPTVLEDGTTKALLLSTLARNYLPDRVEESPTLLLSGPSTSLLHIEDADLLQQTISTEAIRKTGIFDPQAVKDLLIGKRNKARHRDLLLVFTTQLLYRLFGMEI